MVVRASALEEELKQLRHDLEDARNARAGAELKVATMEQRADEFSRRYEELKADSSD